MSLDTLLIIINASNALNLQEYTVLVLNAARRLQVLKFRVLTVQSWLTLTHFFTLADALSVLAASKSIKWAFASNAFQDFIRQITYATVATLAVQPALIQRIV